MTSVCGPTLVVHHVARRGASDKAKENAGTVVARRARAAYERFKERKTEMLMLYGSTFVVVHEVLGIASYAITYSLLASGVLDVEHFAGLVGFTEEDAQKKGFSLRDRMVTFAMTVALVKAMDIMGLVPLRWAINILITPRIARYVGPHADKLFHAIKGLVKRKKPPTQGA